MLKVSQYKLGIPTMAIWWWCHCIVRYGVGVSIPSEASTPEPPVSYTETVMPVPSFQAAGDGCSYVGEVAEGGEVDTEETNVFEIKQILEETLARLVW